VNEGGVRRQAKRAGLDVGRRQFLSAAITLGAAAAIRGLAYADPAAAPAPPESGLPNEGLLKGQAGFQPRKPMALPHPEIFGFLSHDQLAQSYQAYRVDFQRLVVAERVLATMPRDGSHENDYGLIRRQQMEAANSVLLHEFYFRNLAVKPMRPSRYILDNLNEHMGSLGSWRADFIECARIAPTWAILVYDPYDDRWHNLPAGEDDAGGWVGANPLVVCDVASHAYLLNYPARSKYVERFIEHIDWDVVAARYRAVDRH
jgi:superoxide dismutase, Fe-Mn family